MELTKIELILEEDSKKFKFILYYDNNIIHILEYERVCEPYFFGQVLTSTTNSLANNEIFNLLNIFNPNAFVQSVVGYQVGGIWPEVETKKDFIKVLHALECYLEM